jgi:hypothetical protein
MTPKRHRSVKHRKRCSKSYKKMMKMEGGDASTYAASVYGGIGQQHPVSDTNHTIAMNKVDCGMKGGDASPLSTPTSLSPAPLNGGNPLREEDDDEDEDPPLHGGGEDASNDRNIAGGDSVLADLAVPAVLLVANQAMSKGRRKTSKKSRKNRRYRKKRSARRRR